ncbi:paralemmin-3 [Pygocentrus nattereri]|uniref:Uncharacterized protein n=1 Tax=Pygocentrus nattereri TaxID=42514 RepID=A0A3B4D884_PYGNA|nr:paralemmin-3 [Pygocentrus nattereri]XP_017577589.1 paralemmin-3 [Pygocentrus nattereri]XP_037392415.1 paralemmin-3 [Pygocentrus nattereri]
MDEAEKYQQRLQAIAEKRRLQEEQDRAKRALEDEKIRLQQQKRKSLRDQWLMEGPPTSPDSAGPRSPLWGSKAQQIEAHIEKLQSETERLGEAVERLQDQIENSSDSTQPHAGHHSNTEGNAAVTAGHSVEVNDIPEETTVTPKAPTLTNGSMEEEKPHKAPVQDGLVHANGLNEGPVTLTFLGFSEAEPGQGVSDDDSTIIRAERVIITDEGEVIPEGSTEEETPAKEPGENSELEEEEAETQGAENHLEGSAKDHTAHGAVTEGEEKTTESDTDDNEDTSACVNEDTSACVNEDTSACVNEDTSANVNGDTRADANGDTRADANGDTRADANGDTRADASADSSTEANAVSNTDINGDTSADTTNEKSSEDTHLDSSADSSAEVTTPALEESAAEGEVEQKALEEPTSSEPKLQSETVEGAVEAPAQSSAAPNLETIQQEARNPTVSFSNSETPAPSSPGQFQDVPLDGAAEEAESSRKQLADGQLVEEQPLLASKAAPLTDAASPNRAEDAAAPKRKTCQCCSLM